MRPAFLRQKLTPVLWLDLAAAVAALALIFVHALQRYGGYTPCELCLKEREVFWIALAVALIARGLALRVPTAGRIGCMALGVTFAIGAVLGGYHAGVEWRWWPGPASCTGRIGLGALRSADLLAAIRRPAHVVACDQAALRVFGVSLAGWNALLCLGLAAMSFAAPAIAPRRSRSWRRR